MADKVPAISGQGWMALALQSDFDTAAGAPTIYLPLAADEDMKFDPDWFIDPSVEGLLGPIKYIANGQNANGGVAVNLVPGSVATLMQWIMDRTDGAGGAAGSGNVGKSATMWICVVKTVKKFTGVKVNQATFRAEKRQPLRVTLALHGKDMATVANSGFTPTHSEIPPYMFSNCRLQIADFGEALATNEDFEHFEWSVNNKLDVEGHRLKESPWLHVLHNQDREVSGNFGHDFVNEVMFDQFLAGLPTAFNLRFSRTVGGTPYVLTFDFPRVLHNAHPFLGGTREKRIVDNGDFTALMNTNGSAEITWS